MCEHRVGSQLSIHSTEVVGLIVTEDTEVTGLREGGGGNCHGGIVVEVLGFEREGVAVGGLEELRTKDVRRRRRQVKRGEGT